MSSGVKVDDEVKETYQSVSVTTQKTKKYKYAVFTFAEPKHDKIIVERKGEKGEEGWQYESLIASLPAEDVRYVIYDFEFINKEGNPSSKMILISWHPENCKIKRKMLISSSFNILKTALGISQNIFEGDSPSDVSSETVLAKLGGQKATNE